MDGATTEQEERLLTEYFSEATDVPKEWKAYSVLFHGFQKENVHEPQNRMIPLKHWLALAASLLLLFGFGWSYLHWKEPKTSAPIVPAKQMVIAEPKVEQSIDETPVEKNLLAQEPRKSARRKSQNTNPLPPPAEEESEASPLLDIDMEAVHQRGEDLRLAMTTMNQELLEMEY